MESLNKQQLILLALLVSFVTSLATGIVTVSLMEQAPPAITQTINRVVEKTIERVVTEPNKQAAAVVTKETVVVKADEAVIEAIQKNSESIVRVKEVTSEGAGTRRSFAAIGLVISKDGLIAADLEIAYKKNDENGNPVAESYVGVFPDGRIFPLNIVSTDQESKIIFFQPLLQDREKGAYRFVPPAFSAAPLALGQTVIALGGEEGNSVSTGIISNLIEKPGQKTSDPASPPAEKMTVGVKTDMRAAELTPGSVLINLSGEVVGINAGTAASARNIFTPIQTILEALSRATAGGRG